MKKEELVGFVMVIILTLGFFGSVVYSSDKTLTEADTTVTFTKDILPVIKTSCAPCHTGTIPSLPNLTEYKTSFNKRYIIKYKVWSARTMPPGGNIEEGERKLIRDWVSQGGKE